MNWAAIEFSPLLPWPVLAAAAVASVVVAALLLVVRARGGGFRIAAIAILLLALLNPSVVQEEREPQKDVAVLLVDETPSIGLGGRRQQVADAAAKIEARLAELSRTLETRVVRVRHATIADGAEGSKLIKPLTRALQDVPKGRVAGAILLTDGQVHDRRCMCWSPGVGTRRTGGWWCRTHRHTASWARISTLRSGSRTTARCRRATRRSSRFAATARR
jgi:hypothetical protein